MDDLPISNALDLIDFDAYSDKELVRIQQELSKKIKFLDLENKIFESYLNRVTSTGKDDDHNAALQEAEGAERAKEARREKKKKGEKVKEQDKPVLLNTEQKAEIATRELEELRDEIGQSKEDWGKIIDNYKAELEEVEIRVAETKKAMYEFKRDIEQQAVNKRTGKIIAERVVRYFEDKIKAKEAIIEKIRLKNVTLKVQKNKLHLQLKQKEEMGEVLHAIDFDQLQIENKQYLQKIEERNAELLKLKMTAGNSLQTLNQYKKKLGALSIEVERLSIEIAQRKDLLQKLMIEEQVGLGERDKAQRLNKWLNKQMGEFRVPDVMEYVVLKASNYDLEKKLKGWKRKFIRMRHLWHRIAAQNEKKPGEKKRKEDHLPDLQMKIG